MSDVPSRHEHEQGAPLTHDCDRWCEGKHRGWLKRERVAAPEISEGCPCTLIGPCSVNCTCANPVMSGGCSRCCRYGSLEQRTAQAQRLAAPEISEAMLPESGIDIYVHREGGKLPIHISRSSLLAALREARKEGNDKATRSRRRGRMLIKAKRICSWCNADLGIKIVESSRALLKTPVLSGICDKCVEQLREQHESP